MRVKVGRGVWLKVTVALRVKQGAIMEVGA